MNVSLGDNSELFPFLEEELYYVANNLVSHKGKSVIFRGDLVISERNDLISYLKNAIKDHDLRPLLIAPFFSTRPQQVIFVTEDECHLYSAA